MRNRYANKSWTRLVLNIRSHTLKFNIQCEDISYPCLVFYRYFDTFDVISDMSASDRLHLAHMTTKCSTQQELGEVTGGLYFMV